MRGAGLPAATRFELFASLRSPDPVLLILRVSLVATVINSNDDPFLLPLTAAVAVVALPNVRVLTSPWLWYLMFAGIGVRQLMVWETLDDHVAVTTYWIGAVALGLRASSPQATLATCARLLVGVTFACAAAWKIGSPEYLNGSFWRHTLLFDHRFEPVARWLGGTTDQMLNANHRTVEALSGTAAATGASSAVGLAEGPRHGALALLFTWWGLLIEVAVGIAFLVGLPARWTWVRHALLAAFALTTYLVVPVGGFIALLVMLGLAQVLDQGLRRAYLAGGLGLLAWAGIWPALFL